jgi:hypothetical protein
VGAGIAFAAVTLPFSGDGNTINGCYSDNGKIVLLTPSSPQCQKKSHPIQWNVSGPPGAPGNPGANGVSPTVTQLASGDSHCSNGGAAITDAHNTTAYVCSGAPFSGTFTAGQYSISVTSSGITLAGPGSEKVTLTQGGIAIDGGPGSLDAKAGPGGVSLESPTSLNLKGVTTKVEGTGLLDLTAPLTRLNGGCRPVARVGDQTQGLVNVPVTPFAAPVIGTIVLGSPTVLSC